MDESQTIRVSVEEAAALLGIEKSSFKKRVQRGKLRSKKDARVITWVYLDRSETGRDELVGELRDRVRFLERRLDEERKSCRRADTIIAQLTQANAALAARVPELEDPREAPGASETAAEASQGAEPRPAAGEARATTQQQARRPTEGVEHDASTLREWTGDVETRRRSDAGEAQEGAQRRSWWRRVFGG